MQKPSKSKLLEKLEDKLFIDTALPFYPHRRMNDYIPVFGEGSVNAKIILVGEYPGKSEAKTGLVFAGGVRQPFSEILTQSGIIRKEVYVTLMVKDRPLGRLPRVNEIRAYTPYLAEQIRIIEPRVVVGLGKTVGTMLSRMYVLPPGGVAELHGQELKTLETFGEFAVLLTFHPSILLQKKHFKKTIIRDLIKAKQIGEELS